jgi:signal transduction histidine kinase
MGAAESSQKSERVRAGVLIKLSEELDKSLSEISHEVDFVSSDRNNPITEQLAESMEFISERVKKAKIAVDGLQFMYDVQQSKKMVTVSIVDLTSQAATRFQALADENSVNLILEIPDEPIFVLADIDQIGQVFDTLIHNAIRVSQSKDVEISVRQDKVGNPHVTIRDSGPGIPKSTVPKVFDPFFTLEQYNFEDQEQVGVSLALISEIIKTHGGKMWVESRLEVGSIFHFTLKPAIK